MSDLTAIVLMLAAFGLATASVPFYLARMYKRSDDIVTGIVDGVPISRKYRWLLLFNDYLGVSFGLTFIMCIWVVGFLAASEAASDPNVRTVAYFCAGMAGWAATFNLLLGTSWVVHFVSVLRKAKAD
jgi:type IV secretory pathway TrbD component